MVWGSNPSGCEIFRTCPDRPWGPPSLLYNGYRVFPGGKERPVCDADPPPPSSAVGHERVELYLYSPYGPYGLYRASVPVQGWTFLSYSSLSRPSLRMNRAVVVLPCVCLWHMQEQCLLLRVYFKLSISKAASLSIVTCKVNSEAFCFQNIVFIRTKDVGICPD